MNRLRQAAQQIFVVCLLTACGEASDDPFRRTGRLEAGCRLSEIDRTATQATRQTMIRDPRLAAEAGRLEGCARVEIQVDERGHVTEARVRGHPRPESDAWRQAAMSARFQQSDHAWNGLLMLEAEGDRSLRLVD
jgi:hypothetical protein